MSTHPNAILMLVLAPQGLARKTYAAIKAEAGVDEDDDIKIGEIGYHHLVMEGHYDEGYQISAPEGSIVLFDLMTYGYGEVIAWDEASRRKDSLEAWAKGVCERHHCEYLIQLTANYW